MMPESRSSSMEKKSLFTNENTSTLKNCDKSSSNAMSMTRKMTLTFKIQVTFRRQSVGITIINDAATEIFISLLCGRVCL
jgi:hypothetical protein